MSDKNWKNVSQDKPCEICGKPDWCSISLDGEAALCRRENKEALNPDWRFIKELEDSNGEEQYLWKWSQIPVLEANHQTQLDPDEHSAEKHEVYCLILDELELSVPDQENLNERGFTDEKIEDLEYRTMPHDQSRILEAVLDAEMDNLLPYVPGFYLDEEQDWCFNAPPGLVIPVRNLDREIVALKVRCTDSEGTGKYVYVSSKNKPGGSGPGAPAHVPVIRHEEDCSTVRLTEGELKADVATYFDEILTIGFPGVSGFRKALPILQELGAQTVHLAFDVDFRENPNVAKALVRAVQFYSEEFEVVVETWKPKHGKGVDDLLANDKTPKVLSPEKWEKLRQKLMQKFDIRLDPKRPQIVVLPPEHEVNDRALQVLGNVPGLFQRDDRLVLIKGLHHQQEMPATLEHSSGFLELNEWQLREELSRCIQWMKPDKSGTLQPTHTPVCCVKTLLHKADYPPFIRKIKDVVTRPVIRPDGKILAEPGYDADTQILYNGDRLNVSVPDEPDWSDAQAAVKVLQAVVTDFPFEHKVHESVFVAFVLTLLGRHMFNGPSPMFLIDSNVPGAGKGLLCDLVSLIDNGQPAIIIALPRNHDEMRKKITSFALAGVQLLIIDNVDGHLGGDVIEGAITGAKWRDRQLGSNDTVTVDLNMIWCANGNNIEPSRDLIRRVVHIRLNSPEERPEERTKFEHPNLREWVKSHRAELVSAGLTILKGFIVNGQPDQQLPPFGSFEQWSAFIREAVVWAGLPDPYLSKQMLSQQGDKESQILGRFLSALLQVDSRSNRKPAGLTTTEILNFVKDISDDSKQLFQELKEAIQDLCPEHDGLPNSQSLGKKLGRLKDRVVQRKRLVQQLRRNTSFWVVEEMSSKKCEDGGDGGDHFSLSKTVSAKTNPQKKKKRVRKKSQAPQIIPSNPTIPTPGHPSTENQE